MDNEFDYVAFTRELEPLYRLAGYGERESLLLAALASNTLMRSENMRKFRQALEKNENWTLPRSWG